MKTLFRFASRLACGVALCACAGADAAAPNAEASLENTRDTGYRGIWFTLGQMGEYGDKYSGGLGTYTAKHRPLAVYAPAVDKTFFVYAGTKKDKRHLLIMASCFDHARGVVPRPTIVCDKLGVNDPHDNASIALDGEGHVWVFVSGRGKSRPGFKYRSLAPYSVEAFEKITEEEMTYPQPWWVEGRGFIHMFTRYTAGRELYWNTSPDGRNWTAPRKLAGMGGHYEISSVRPDGRVATAFNYHPGGSVDKRTNIYYLQSDDMGETWQTISGTTLETPLEKPDTPALVKNYEADGQLAYIKDLAFDDAGNPVILHLTSHHHMPGPQGDPRLWRIARWNGEAWEFHEVTSSTHNYDTGQLWIHPGKPWRIIAPTEAGAARWGAGGEVVLWESANSGQAWTRARQLTQDSPMNHGYVRRPEHAHPDFYAFWADGRPDGLSPSRLYFTNQACDTVWQLPYDMETDEAQPTVWQQGKK